MRERQTEKETEKRERKWSISLVFHASSYQAITVIVTVLLPLWPEVPELQVFPDSGNLLHPLLLQTWLY